jgi:UDP-glucose 4-epimerase
MRVAVTGAAGYVGWAVVHELLAANHEVIALVHRADADFPAGVVSRRADLLDQTGLTTALEGVEGVCHLAGLARARSGGSQPTRYYRVNVGGGINVLDALAVESRRRGKPGNLVFASTSSVYGKPTQQPISEEANLAFLNPYGASKVACEQAIGWQVGTGGLGATTLRLFNPAGGVAGRADRDLTRIIPAAVAVANGSPESLRVNGDGAAVRDFVHVQDVARAFVLALEANEAGRHAVYNVGAVSASVGDVIRATERITGRTVPIRHLPAVAGEAATLIADTTRIRAALGWKPRFARLDDLIKAQAS